VPPSPAGAVKLTFAVVASTLVAVPIVGADGATAGAIITLLLQSPVLIEFVVRTSTL
jgi:hypothetical protein